MNDKKHRGEREKKRGGYGAIGGRNRDTGLGRLLKKAGGEEEAAKSPGANADPHDFY